MKDEDPRPQNNCLGLNVILRENLSVSDCNIDNEPETKDQSCQKTSELIITEFIKSHDTLVCNRFIYDLSDKHDAETQTDIQKSDGEPAVNVNKVPLLKTQDCCVQTNNVGFFGSSSIKTDEHMTELAGTTFHNFRILLRRMKPDAKNEKFSNEDKLLIFLVKMKTGLSYAAMSVVFHVHRTTISRIFISVLDHLTGATQDFVYWPNKMTVLGTIPDFFKPEYSNTRVILDCTVLRIDIPSSVEIRVFTYSHYKHGFTAKVLFGITPAGLISYKFPASGGRKSDSQLTNESHIVDLLENDDVVLADKGFPEIQTTLDESGKRIRLVMSPFLENHGEFTEQEAGQTCNIARVRIHVERIMQRSRLYNILNKIPEHLFVHLDDIIHMCCVLVNLQPPILK